MNVHRHTHARAPVGGGVGTCGRRSSHAELTIHSIGLCTWKSAPSSNPIGLSAAWDEERPRPLFHGPTVPWVATHNNPSQMAALDDQFNTQLVICFLL